MRILAVDYGDARTGLALCDSRETLASPLGVIREKNIERVVAHIAAAVQQHGHAFHNRGKLRHNECFLLFAGCI